MDTGREKETFCALLSEINKETGRNFVLDPKYPDQPVEPSEPEDGLRLRFKITETSMVVPGTLTYSIELEDFGERSGSLYFQPAVKEHLKQALMKFWQRDKDEYPSEE